ncbi:MAG: class I SAM-dependent methyltransferase [Desulfobulbales bacterium]|nr:class I SAM-dependent methyltransferase [Desulfobulbales bacterium]
MRQENYPLSIAVSTSAAAFHDMAASLSGRLSLPLLQSESEDYEFLLFYTSEGLVLKQTGKNNLGSIMVNFTSPAMTYRLKHGGGRRQALARAAGLKRGWQPAVIDATAGLGRDGFILAHLGCQVHMLERSQILAVLLEDGLQRAEQSKQAAAQIVKRLRLTQTDSEVFLRQLGQDNYPDVIYLDPMYPERTKSSLVKKEMRILRRLAGEDRDTAGLLAVALDRARNRVVVKRPRLAKPLSRLVPSHQIKGKTSRFDVYLT